MSNLALKSIPGAPPKQRSLLAVKEQDKSRVYFDGACYLCSTEIEHYKSIDKHQSIHFVDISDPSFNLACEPLPQEIRLEDLQRKLHVRGAEGVVHVGVDSFIHIWSLLPDYRFLSRFAANPIVRAGLELFYICFAYLRPLLPRKPGGSSRQCKHCPSSFV